MKNNLKEKRQEAGLNQRQLAEKAHLPQSAVSDIELGKREPWPKALKRLARALKVEISELFPDLPATKE